MTVRHQTDPALVARAVGLERDDHRVRERSPIGKTTDRGPRGTPPGVVRAVSALAAEEAAAGRAPLGRRDGSKRPLTALGPVLVHGVA